MHRKGETVKEKKLVESSDNFIRTFHPLSKITPKREGKQIDIKVEKVNGFEPYFEKRIESIRENEEKGIF